MKNIIEKFKIYGADRFFSYGLAELKNKLITQLLKGSYSQKGEDLVIDKLLGYKKSGFYVDIGANDPTRFSNTKKFYLKGWRGINIEPDFNNYQKFVKKRKNDINLNMGIGQTQATLKFYRFMPDTLSTFSQKEADSFIKQGYKLENVIDVVVNRLADVLNEYCVGKEIDFINIDTEGFDMAVLRGNDWRKFSPALVCIETAIHSIDGKDNRRDDKQGLFLENMGYKKVYDNGLNSIYGIKTKNI